MRARKERVRAAVLLKHMLCRRCSDAAAPSSRCRAHAPRSGAIASALFHATPFAAAMPLPRCAAAAIAFHADAAMMPLLRHVFAFSRHFRADAAAADGAMPPFRRATPIAAAAPLPLSPRYAAMPATCRHIARCCAAAACFFC